VIAPALKARFKMLVLHDPRRHAPCLFSLKIRQTDRQTDRPTDRQTDRQTGRQADRQTGRQADRQTGGQADR